MFDPVLYLVNRRNVGSGVWVLGGETGGAGGVGVGERGSRVGGVYVVIVVSESAGISGVDIFGDGERGEVGVGGKGELAIEPLGREE